MNSETANQKTEQSTAFDSWALVEIMGHQRIVGKVTEATLAGGAFLRVDVPAFNGAKAFTRFYSPGSIYCISPLSEDVARGLLATNRNEPVSRFELPQLAEKVSEGSPITSGVGGAPCDDYCPECRELEGNCCCGGAEEDD